ncbi:MAG TPA: N,N-dimethylformamidase beta subunit family domain-containing protein [Acidimicrobiales bacterium]|nr:N,N-dimethylformamidase beta subunit family domain-containing protein [Acidimicrobiales bacterium]
MAGYQGRHRAAEAGHRRLWAVVAAVVVAAAGIGAYAGLSGGPDGTGRAGGATGHTSAGAAGRSGAGGTGPAQPSPSAPPTTAVPVAAPFTAADTAAWVAQENAEPGSTAWKLTKPATSHQIAGYADTVSVDVGAPVHLYVSTTAPTWTVQAFRMGWYGGDQGRLVWSSPAEPGVAQPACPLQQPLHTTECQWQQPLAVSTTGWVQGTYLFKLQSSTGWQSYIPLTVRDDASHSAYLVNDSVTTWQAYNTYGGYDLYQGPNGALASRARAVSFDRPYDLGQGAGDFLGLELPMISMMESHGLDVSYTTDIDLAGNPAVVKQHRTFVSLGHDEYYSLSMFDGLTAARDSGVSLIFLGANAVYRHIRLAGTPLGPNRLEIDYKDATADPLYGHDNADVTPWAWRSPPNNRPESALLGEMWQCNPVRADMVVTDPGNWVYSGSGLGQGARIAGIVGPEYDHFSPSSPNPGDVTVLASSPVDCNGIRSTADMTYYSAPSGAGVWDTGTIDWVGQVRGSCLTCAAPNPVTRITDNVLAAFGSGDPGRVHPSAANMGGAPGQPAP